MGSKAYKFEFICEHCKKPSKARDVKAKWCKECKDAKYCCECGCGKQINSMSRMQGHRFAAGCQKRGKSYKEIYGTDTPGCGFKTGANNPNYDPILKKKANKSLLKWYKNNPDKTIAKLNKGTITRGKIESIGEEHFRSQWEKDVYLILKKNNIKFEREVGIPLVKGIKIVDFVVEGDIYIEVSGFSYAIDRKKFKNKIKFLMNAVDKPIIIVTTEPLYNDIKKSCWFINTFTCLKTEEEILKKINFCRLINGLNIG